MKHSIITLSSDFGMRDEYVGVMKGVILSRNPHCTIVDLTHYLDAGRMEGAALLLASAWPNFPDGTVHVIVVDPGVGTGRRIILATADGHFFIGPDNGIIPALLQKDPEEVFVVDCPRYYKAPVSNTFHGRDIMAPVAARLAAGLQPEKVGPGLAPEELFKLPDSIASTVSESHQLSGRIVHIDHFGNLLTNIESDCCHHFLAGHNPNRLLLSCCNRQLPIHPAEAYGDGPDKTLLLIKGSRNHMEISINGGSAAAFLEASPGDIVFLYH